MDFKDTLQNLANRIDTLKDSIQTEEATKNAFIMPFIQSLGYDVFNPTEVIPEMNCDLIKKKGEKIDYAIIKDGEPIMLIECKAWMENLDLHSTQLQKYYVASKAKFGILTNGIIYRFYTDLVKTNIMDDVPFLEVDICNITSSQIEELEKFQKSNFDVDSILCSASELKYISGIKNAIKNEFTNPSQELVKLLSKKVYDGTMTAKVMEAFTALVKRSLKLYINETLSSRLSVAINHQEDENTPPEEPQEDSNPKVITTNLELEGFYVVKSIIRQVMDASRITYRDAQSYFAVFVDDNNRKPICRLYFNNESNMQIAMLDEAKKETKYKLQSIEDIYSFSDQLIETAKRYV